MGADVALVGPRRGPCNFRPGPRHGFRRGPSWPCRGATRRAASCFPSWPRPSVVGPGPRRGSRRGLPFMDLVAPSWLKVPWRSVVGPTGPVSCRRVHRCFCRASSWPAASPRRPCSPSWAVALPASWLIAGIAPSVVALSWLLSWLLLTLSWSRCGASWPVAGAVGHSALVVLWPLCLGRGHEDDGGKREGPRGHEEAHKPGQAQEYLCGLRLSRTNTTTFVVSFCRLMVTPVSLRSLQLVKPAKTTFERI